ncbi:DUF4162 domain-containing protein [Planctomycetota bacterium]|nr:DUF4162 domain-containing protein [Planctomycetota bacterium]
MLISSHILSELDRICNRVAVIEDGRVRYTGPAGDLAQRLSGEQRIRLKVLSEDQANGAVAALEAVEAVSDVHRDGLELSLILHGAQEDVPALLKALVAKNVELYAFEVEAPSLETLFLDVTRGIVT